METDLQTPINPFANTTPGCEVCEHFQMERDPYATGDGRYTEPQCAAHFCPYGKE